MITVSRPSPNTALSNFLNRGVTLTGRRHHHRRRGSSAHDPARADAELKDLAADAIEQVRGCRPRRGSFPPAASANICRDP